MNKIYVIYFIFYAYSVSPPSYTSLTVNEATTKNILWDFTTSTHNQQGLAFDVRANGAFIKANSEL